MHLLELNNKIVILFQVSFFDLACKKHYSNASFLLFILNCNILLFKTNYKNNNKKI